MTQLATYPLRIRYNVDAKTAQNTDGSNSFSVWRGNDVSFACAVFYKSAPLDLTNVASMKLQLKSRQNPTEAALAEVELLAADIVDLITAEDWLAETTQNAVFTFSAAQMNQDLNNEATKLFWLVLSGLTDAGKSITYGAAVLEIKEDNAGFAGSPPAPAENYYTEAEVDALLATRPPSLALTTHQALRDITTLGGLVAQYTIRECFISGMIERFIFDAGTDADDDANVLRPTDYNASTNANVWKRVG